MLLPAAGCYRRVSYQSPEGRRVEVVNLGFDTRITGLEAETSDGRLRIESAESRASLADRLAEALLRELGGAVSRSAAPGGVAEAAREVSQ